MMWFLTNFDDMEFDVATFSQNINIANVYQLYLT
jgi:hypothetical protein